MRRTFCYPFSFFVVYRAWVIAQNRVLRVGTILTFKYDHNGLCTQKKVVENGIATTYDYNFTANSSLI